MLHINVEFDYYQFPDNQTQVPLHLKFRIEVGTVHPFRPASFYDPPEGGFADPGTIELRVNDSGWYPSSIDELTRLYASSSDRSESEVLEDIEQRLYQVVKEEAYWD